MMTADTPHTRYDLLRHLEANGIQTRVIFSGNIVRHPAYRGRLAAPAGDLAVADAVMARGFLLGAHHGMAPQEVDIVADTVDEFFTRRERATP
jgi:CDP-6-deoxy-D-xylo-4-hexulose-3-dehydrase